MADTGENFQERMTAMRDPHHWTATEALAELRARRIGAVELLDHMMARQARLDGAVNAVIATDPERARAAARAADAASPVGALHGLPMTIKETWDLVGFTTTAGIPDLAGNHPTRDADAVARLKAAGAVIWGKTNVPLAAADHQSVNPLYGLTRNPWDAGRSAGGSSGGAAAALAAGFTALELGSDIGGSIRIPAHYCGVWGLKPSYGLISCRGHVPPGPGALSSAPLSVGGPLARSTADLRLAFGLLAGGLPGWALDLPPARVQGLKGARIAVWTGGYPVDPAYAAAIEAYAHALAAEGAVVTHLDTMPAPMVGADELYLRLLFAVIGAESPPQELAGYAAMAAARPDDAIVQTIAGSVRASMAEVAHLIEAQAQVIAAWDQWFTGFDALLAPVSMGQAFPHQVSDGFGPVPQMARVLEVGGVAQPYMKNLLWPGIATFAHLPSLVRPIPGGVAGLPTGVQLIGPALGENTLFAIDEACTTVFGRFVAPGGFE